MTGVMDWHKSELKSDTSMKERSFFYSLTAIVVTILAIGIVGGGWLLAQAPWRLWQGGTTAPPQAAMFVPSQAPVMTSLLVNPDRLASVQQLWTPPAQRRRAAAEVQAWQQSLWSRLQLDYATDVQPWLGDEVTVAVTTPDLDRDRSNGEQAGYLVALSTQDPAQSQAMLASFWQAQAASGQDLVFERYAGVEITHNQVNDPDQVNDPGASLPPATGWLDAIATAAIGNQFILFANDPKVLREAINNVQAPNLSLAQNPAYQSALEALPANHVGLVYTKLPELTAWLNQSILATVAISDPTPAPAQFDRLIAALTLKTAGILVETAFLPPPGVTLLPQSPRLTAPVSAQQYLPADSVVMLAGEDLAQTWTGLVEGLTGYGAISTLVSQPLQWLQTEWNLDLASQIFPAAAQDYALGLANRAVPSQVEWVFVAKQFGSTHPTDSPALTVAQLDDRAQQEGFTIGQLTLAEQPVTIWTRLSTADRAPHAAPTLQANIVGAHTTLGDYTIIASDLPGLEAAIQAPSAAAPDRDRLGAAMNILDPDNNGYLYLDWTAFKPWIERRSPLLQLAETSLNPLIQHLDSVTVTSYERTPKWQRSALFIHWVED